MVQRTNLRVVVPTLFLVIVALLIGAAFAQ